VGHSNVLPKIITRKVKVKQVDQASIAQLRLKHFSTEAKVKSPTARDIIPVAGIKVVASTKKEQKEEEKEEQQEKEEKRTSVLSLFDNEIRKLLSSRPEFVDKSLKNILRSVDDDEFKLGVFRTIAECDDDIVKTVAITCKRRPHFYFELVSFLFKSMCITKNKECFEAITIAAKRLGNAMETDSAMFCDYAMPLASFQHLLAEEKSHRRRAATVSVLKSFISSQNSIELLKRLKYELGNDDVFLMALSYMIETDALQRMLDENEKSKILNFYMDHCEIALKSQNTHVFAAGLSMLGLIAESRRQFSSDRLDVLESACYHKSGIVRAQAYITVATLIPCYDVPSPEHDHLTKLTIKALKSKNCKDTTTRLAVTHLLIAASLEIAEHEDTIEEGDAMAVLLRWCLNMVLEMPTDLRAKCLSTADSSTVEIEGVVFDVPVLPKCWDPCSVVNDVAQNITSQKHDFIEPEYMEVVAAAVVSSTPSLEQQKERWIRSFARTGLRDYVFVAMCDPDCCDYAIRTLHTFVNGPELLRDLVLKADALVGAIRLLFSPDSESDALSQHSVVAFFDAGVSSQGEVAESMKRVLRAARAGLNLTPELSALYDKIE
jgi:hypothetical protein